MPADGNKEIWLRFAWRICSFQWGDGMMNFSLKTERLTAGICVVLLIGLILGGVAPSAFPQSEGVDQAVSDGIIDQLLTFIHTAAGIIGDGLVKLVDMVAGVDVSELSDPLGYLGILTASLILFGALEAARKVVWFVVSLGWGLIIIRIVLEVLDKNPIQ